MFCVDRPYGMDTTGANGGLMTKRAEKGCKRVWCIDLKVGLVIDVIPDSSFVEGRGKVGEFCTLKLWAPESDLVPDTDKGVQYVEASTVGRSTQGQIISDGNRCEYVCVMIVGNGQEHVFDGG
ncbi:hypothetical protein WAI453_003877 [Rhynchosporium graminicola]